MAKPAPVSALAISRRSLLSLLGAAGGTLALDSFARRTAAAQGRPPMSSFTGPGANPYWNSVGPYVSEPQKAPLLLLTDRGVQLETPRSYFQTAITPNHAFYVRWHLDGIPNAVDLKTWRLQVEGNVAKPVSYSLAGSSGNSRLKRSSPRINALATAAAVWSRALPEGNGAMALWATPDGPVFGCGSFFARPLRRPVPCRFSFKDSRAGRDRKVWARTSFRSRST